jgi:hypothetical protein
MRHYEKLQAFTIVSFNVFVFAFNGKSTNTFEPALVKVMAYSEIIGSEPFGGDVFHQRFRQVDRM